MILHVDADGSAAEGEIALRRAGCHVERNPSYDLGKRGSYGVQLLMMHGMATQDRCGGPLSRPLIGPTCMTWSEGDRR